MQFSLTKSSDDLESTPKTIEIETLEELRKLAEESGVPLILFFEGDDGPAIEIYDDYRE